MNERAGKYRILECIAEGGMGEVYRAHMDTIEGFEKLVALKLVRPALDRDPAFSAMFVAEAKVAMTLSHANVAQAFDVGRIDDRWFLAMEYVEGLDLSTLLKASAASGAEVIHERHALLIAIEALKGLDYAHRRKDHTGRSLQIVHRDVSPGNLLISFEGEVKVVDFGISKSAVRVVAAAESNLVMGKVPYMAPEQLHGKEVDLRADLYAMGAVLFEMLTGARRVPDESYGLAVARVLSGNAKRPREIRASVPERLEQIVLKATALEPSARYASAAAMRQDLEAYGVASQTVLSTADLGAWVTELSASGGAVSSARVDRAATATTGKASADPFGAMLGQELEWVETTNGVSQFTARARRTPAAGGFPSPARPRRARRRWLVAASLLAAVVGVTAGLWPRRVEPHASAGSDGSEDPAPIPLRPDNGASSDVARNSGARTVPGPARATQNPTVPLPPVPDGAKVPTPGETHRPQGARPSPAASVVPAELSVNTDPWSYVELDGRRLRATPVLRVPIAPGRHRLVLRNPTESLERMLDIEVAPGEHRRVTLDLRQP